MKIIWAVDAFEDNKELNQKMADYLHLLYQATQSDIEPIYLLREREQLMPGAENPNWAGDHSKTAESLFREMLADYNLSFFTSAKVLPHTSPSHSGAAEVLDRYATQANADLILVGSHSRQGIQRVLLGSFAESLLMRSSTPVCIIGAHTTKTNTSRMILFPTEFGEHSQKSFRFVMNLAKQIHSEIFLFHAIERPIEGLFEVGAPPSVYRYKGKMLTLDQIIEAQVENQTRKAQIWVDWSQKNGVKTRFFIDRSFKPIDELIMNMILREEIDLVTMEAQSGPVGAALLGSCTRSIARSAPCPVFVLPRHYYDKNQDHFPKTPSP